ncbi:autotransporter outer membrane beta-barrel domain-containing protein [Actinobacillus porcinus]|uniref:autotransporter outer membrane beta-barrel domain-containing protein n=1 Tax=Actinobacillus porcinus TaxID=51048 RepID=UPI0023F457DB|nr:autotransporter outer membrane beta-barrel domain-containing protein [Actinobacillus porcinus]MDD7545787.1 autotransporter outer membrane beta-barrel domain-containing protein [Actinobacillus porcinus]MDY5848595.1 autotransporter outer membrane beta-barrel domain-containing protein [Actinobacillus porcinus]
MKKFQLSAITASLMFAFSDAYAADIEHTCNVQTQCNYSEYQVTQIDVNNIRHTEYYRIFNSDTVNTLGLKADNLNVKLLSQPYQNQAAASSATSSTVQPHLININNSNRDLTGNHETGKAQLLVPTGATLTLENFSSDMGASVISLEMAEATIEKGVKIILGKSYEEINNLDQTPNFYGIHASGENTKVTNSADIEVKAEEGTAIYIADRGTLTSNNHNIILNSQYATGIEVTSGSTATINNVNISGDNVEQTGIATEQHSSYTQINNSKIDLTGDESGGISVFNAKVDVTNSDINAPYAMATEAFGYENSDDPIPSSNIININKSDVKGRNSLLVINPSNDGNTNAQTQMDLVKISLNAQDSKLYGGVLTTSFDEDTPEWFRNNLVMTLNNSQWTINHDSKFQQLDMNDGSQVIFERKNGFTTLSLEKLSGTGSFTLNTDLANRQSDKIVVTGSDSGSFGLNIKDSGNEPNAENGKVTLVETATGTAKFALLGKDYVDAGAYRYRLVKEGNNWILSNKAAEKSSPSTAQGGNQSSANAGSTAGTGTSSGSSSTATAQVALTEKSNALVSLRQAQLALVESNLEGLHQRLGELKNGEKGNVWVRNVNSRNKFDSTRTASDSHSSGFEQDVHSVQLGADAALTDNIRLGGFVGNARSDVDFDGKYGSGKVKTQSLGLYGTYLANNGFYWDNVAKYEYVKSESASTGKRKYNAYTLSTEVGRIHQLGQGWTVTPQIQAAWTRLSSQSDEERLSALTARAGVRVAKAIEFDGWKLQPYAEVNGITTQTNNNQVRVNQHRFEVSDVEEGKGRFQTALGINAAVGNHRFGLEGSITNGKYLDQPYKVQAVYRYSW